MLLAINVGGPAYSASNGITYIADSYYVGGQTTDWTYDVTNVVNTKDVPVYLSERWGDFQYSIPMANGAYDVVLQFSELNWAGVGDRRINVSIEGVTVLRDFDIYQSVGSGSALDMNFNGVQVIDGALTIQLSASVDAGTLAGIVVKRSAAQGTVGSGSLPSSNASATAPWGSQLSSAPTNVTASKVLNNQVALKWQAPADSAAVKSYRIYRGGQQVGSVDSALLTYTDINLTPDTSYAYTVRAVDGSNNVSVASSPINIKTLVVSGSLKLSWSRPTTRIDGLTPLYITDIGGYKIRYKLRGASNFEVLKLPAAGLPDLNLVSYTFSNLANGDWDFEVACYVLEGSVEVDGEYAQASF